MTVHYVVMRDRFTEWKMTDNATQTSVSLLRFCDVIPPDKAFYLAGMACRNNKEYESMAFVLLNHYLDISEAIEEGKEDIDCFGGLVEVVFRHSCCLLFTLFFWGGCIFLCVTPVFIVRHPHHRRRQHDRQFRFCRDGHPGAL